MDTKEILINNIRNWVKLDNEIRELRKEENIRKNEKKEMSETIMNIMKQNEIDCVDIKDGQLCYNKQNVKKPLTKKNLMTILSKYFKGNDTRANELNDFILSNREEVVKETIVRKTH